MSYSLGNSEIEKLKIKSDKASDLLSRRSKFFEKTGSSLRVRKLNLKNLREMVMKTQGTSQRFSKRLGQQNQKVKTRPKPKLEKRKREASTTTLSSNKNEEDWSRMANSLRVSEEKGFAGNAKRRTTLTDFYNISIKETTRKPLFNFKPARRRRKKNRNRRILNGEEVTVPVYKRTVKKLSNTRRNLHGLSEKNYHWKKYSVYEHREKFHGVDLVDEFE